jgi:hypothetical protein
MARRSDRIRNVEFARIPFRVLWVRHQVCRAIAGCQRVIRALRLRAVHRGNEREVPCEGYGQSSFDEMFHFFFSFGLRGGFAHKVDRHFGQRRGGLSW